MSGANPIAQAFRSVIRGAGIDRVLPILTQGKSPRSALARLAPNHGQYPRPTLRQVERGGIRYELDLSDFMEWFLYYGLEVEPRDALLNLAREGAVVLDVGANIGETAIKLSRKVGAQGKVFSFEPSPVVGAKLRKNLSLNSIANVEVQPVGLGAEPGEFRLVTPSEGNRGGNKISTSSTGGVTVKVITLDEFMHDKRLTRVDLMKIDVEGFELNVLRGATKLLGRFSPTLFVELDDKMLREQGASARELVAFLESAGYQCQHALTGEKVRPTNDFAGQHFDIICGKS